MTEPLKTVTWQMMTVGAPSAPQTVQQEEQLTLRRIQPHERRLYQPPPAGVTMPKPLDIDGERLQQSLAALPNGLRAEFTVTISRKTSSFYIQKSANGRSSTWAVFALHCDPIYGQWQSHTLPRAARKWLGRTPWATALMIAHEVPAWCISTFPDPRRLPVDHLVSDISNHRVRTIDPILYGVMVAGAQWGFVPLASWRL